jgi:hypothetical protein
MLAGVSKIVVCRLAKQETCLKMSRPFCRLTCRYQASFRFYSKALRGENALRDPRSGELKHE